MFRVITSQSQLWQQEWEHNCQMKMDDVCAGAEGEDSEEICGERGGESAKYLVVTVEEEVLTFFSKSINTAMYVMNILYSTCMSKSTKASECTVEKY